MAQQTVQVQKVFLSSPSHWDVWIKAVKTQALAKEVWDYVNPEGNGPAEPQPPQEVTLERFLTKHGIPRPANPAGDPAAPASNRDTIPPRAASSGTVPNEDDDEPEDDEDGLLTPQPQPRQPSAVSVTQLNSTQLYEYKKEDRKWRTQVEKVERQRKNLAELTHYILDRVSDDYRSRILKEQHPREMIRILKKRVAPTDRAKEIEVINTWKWLKRTPKDTTLSTWLRRWEETYERATELNLPEASGTRPVLDFLDAIEPLSDKFHNYWTEHIQNLQDEGRTTEIPDLYDVLNKFRNRVRLRQLQKGKTTTGFATYQEPEADKDGDNHKNKKPRWPCACGEHHLMDDCDHLHESLRGNNWKEDSKRMAQIQKAEQKTKEAIERSRKRVTKKQTSTSPTAGNQTTVNQYQSGLASIALASSSNLLNSSWVLDSAATDHICNDISLLHDYHPSTVPNKLEAGTQTLNVHGHGTAYITIQTLNGPAKLRLNNVAYIPGFLANLVCFRRFQDRGNQWDTAHARLLDHNGNYLCKVLDHHGLWLLEYNAPKSNRKSSGGVTSSDETHSSDEDPSATAFATAKHSKRPKHSQRPRESNATADLWHQRLGHVGPKVIHHLVKPAPDNDPSGRKTLNGVNITAWDAPETNKCEICAITKAHEIISRRTPETRSRKPFERIHLDIVSMNEAFNLGQYYVHVNCEYTCLRFVKVVQRKSALPQALLDILAFIKRRWNCEVSLIRTDGESTVQQGTNFEQQLVSKGYHVERSPPDTQAQNGKAERAGHVLIQRARALKAQARFPDLLWPEIIITAAYLLNLTPMESLGWASPLEFLQKELGTPNSVPTQAHLVAYGSRAYFHKKNIPKLDRLEPNAGIGYLCGYQSSNIYRIWIPAEKTIKPFRDVTFDEGKFYSAHESDIQAQIKQANEATDIPTATVMDPLNPGEEQGHRDSADESDEDELFNGNLSYQEVDVIDREPSHDASRDPLFELPICHPNDDELDIQFPPTPRQTPERNENAPQNHQNTDTTINDDDDDTIVVMPRSSSNSVTNHPVPSESSSRPQQSNERGVRDPAPRHSEISADVERPELIIPQRTRGKRKDTYAHAVARVGHNAGFHSAFAAGTSQTRQRQHQSKLLPEPKNFKEMQVHPHTEEWLKATTSEFDKLLRNGTAQIVPVPDDVHWSDVLPLTWVWKYKFDQDGYLDKHKARLCVRGDLEKLPDTEETYAATLAARIFRALAAIAAYFDLELQQLDAISAFTNSVLRRKLYVRLPDGFRQTNKCLLLFRALYGLKESGHLWYKEFTGTLGDFGLQCSEDEKCLWYNTWLVIFFFVDDVVAMFKSKHTDKWKQFKTNLCNSYEFKDLGDLKWFLGVRVIRDRPNRKLWLCQDAYIDKIATKFNLTGGHEWATPMALEELGNHYPDEPPSKQTIYHYQQLVGSLNYAAVITRGDTARSASKLSEFLQNPAPQHTKGARRALEYLSATRSLALEYSGPKDGSPEAQNPFQVFSDASFGDCPRTRRSTGGFLITLFGGAIDWRSKRQSCVTLSSTEAELHALTDAAREIQYWKRIFRDIRLTLDQDYSATCDNRQTIRLLTASTPQFTTKLRHVDIKHHWLREKVQNGEITIEWMATADMPADGLTKPLPAQKHLKLIQHMSLVDISDQLARQEPVIS